MFEIKLSYESMTRYDQARYSMILLIRDSLRIKVIG